jgi:hypothetical protein
VILLHAAAFVIPAPQLLFGSIDLGGYFLRVLVPLLFLYVPAAAIVWIIRCAPETGPLRAMLDGFTVRVPILGKAARQLVNHGHVLVNDRRADIPSQKVKPGDVLQIRDRKASRDLVQQWLTEEEGRVVPQWLSADPANFRGEVKALPAREDVSIQVNEQLIVEFCSR